MDYSQFAVNAAVLPNTMPAPGTVLMQQQQQRYEEMYRQRMLQRQNEMEMLNYMNGVLDPSKHNAPGATLTGVVNDQLNGLYNKYSTALKEHQYVDPAEFENNLRGDMGTLIGVEKRANSNFDAQMKALDDLKKLRPDLDTAKARQAMETQIGMNYLIKGKDGSYALNPSADVPYVDMANQLADPLFAAQYSTDKTSTADMLRKTPNGEKMQYGVMDTSGTKRGGYSHFEAQPKYWQEMNFETDPNNKYFTKGGVQPSLKTRGVDGKIGDTPVTMATDDDYKSALGNDILMSSLYKEMANETGLNYEQLNDMRTHNPELFGNLTKAQLYKNMDLAGNKFVSAGYNEPPAPVHYSNTTNINTTPPVNDVYAEVNTKAGNTNNGLLPFNELSPLAQKEILGYVKGSINNNKLDANLRPLDADQSDIAIWKRSDGQLFVVKADPENKNVPAKDGKPANIIMPLDFTSTNWGVQAGAKAKGEVVKQAGNNHPQPQFNVPDWLKKK
jgi:hypothetical protein